jgi:integrase
MMAASAGWKASSRTFPFIPYRRHQGIRHVPAFTRPQFPQNPSLAIRFMACHDAGFASAGHTRNSGLQPMGMRSSEQYGLTWERIDLTRKQVTMPVSKNGKTRHIPLNSIVVAAFKALQQRSLDGSGAVFVNMHGEALQGYKLGLTRR